MECRTRHGVVCDRRLGMRRLGIVRTLRYCFLLGTGLIWLCTRYVVGSLSAELFAFSGGWSSLADNG